MCIIKHVLINYAKIQKKTEKKEVSFTNTLLNSLLKNVEKSYNCAQFI